MGYTRQSPTPGSLPSGLRHTSANGGISMVSGPCDADPQTQARSGLACTASLQPNPTQHGDDIPHGICLNLLYVIRDNDNLCFVIARGMSPPTIHVGLSRVIVFQCTGRYRSSDLELTESSRLINRAAELPKLMPAGRVCYHRANPEGGYQTTCITKVSTVPNADLAVPFGRVAQQRLPDIQGYVYIQTWPNRNQVGGGLLPHRSKSLT